MTPDSTRTDLLVVMIGSTLIAVYLAIQLVQPTHGHGAEPTRPAASFDTQPTPARPRSDERQVIDLDHPPEAAPWVRNGEQVPSWALYPYAEGTNGAPRPHEPGKEQSWYNRILFPPTYCTFCGRRVPNQKGSYVFLLIGFIGQIAFSLRFTVQWIASERKKQSVVPESFWWLSIVGSLLLLTYAISIRAWPIILGQAPNVLIYGRNLHLIRKSKLTAAGEIEKTNTATDSQKTDSHSD